MPTAYSRVTLVNGTRRVDLALPDAVPLSDVMPQLLRFCAPEERPEEPASWTLGRLGGPNLSLAQSLTDAAVADGEVLELRTATAAVHSAYVEDVRDAVEDAVDESGQQWRSRTTVGFSLALGATVLALTALLPAARQPRDAVTLTLAIVVAGLAVVAGWWAARLDHRYAAWAMLATAALWGGVAGWLAAQYPEGWSWAVSVAVALAAALVVTGVARAITTAATAHLAATALLCAAGLPIGALSLAGYDPATALRIDAVLAVLVIGVLPRMSLTVGGLASADYRVRNFGLVTGDQLAARIRQSTALLSGSIPAVSLIGLAIGLVLTGSGSGWDRLLGLSVGLALILRSRAFSRIPHILPPRIAGLIVLVAQGLRLSQERMDGRWSAAVVAAVAIVLVALSAVPLSDISRARLKQLLNVAEMLVVASMVALAGGALGIYDWIREVIH